MATQQLTLPKVLGDAVIRSPDTEALIFPNVRLTYRQFQDRVNAAARSLVGMGIRPGDVIGVLMPNCAENVTLLFASASIGALFVPINNRFRARELAHVIADSGMKVLITNDIVAEQVDYTERLHQALPELAEAAPGATPKTAVSAALSHVVLLGNSAVAGMLRQEQFEIYGRDVNEQQLAGFTAAVKDDQPVLMLYTSGTTAMPKGCPLSQYQIAGISLAIADRLGLVAGDRLWNALPMFHASSLLPMTAAFHKSASFVSQLHFSADQTLRQLVDEKISVAWPAYDLIWQQILTHPDFDGSQLSGLRALLCVGPPETLMLMEKSLPNARILSCYGITECSGVPVMPLYDDDQAIRCGTSGLPMEGLRAEIRDPETGEPVPPRQRGLLWMQGDYVISGYWNDPEKTAASFDQDHWFNTGDLCSMDENGYIYFHGRLKDTLKVGGENVAAVEVEAFLTTHPAVKLAAVIGVPDQKLQEVPAAFVELRPGASITETEIIQFCKDNLAGFKVPRYVRFVTEWPMSATKIRKDDLRAPLLQELGIDG